MNIVLLGIIPSSYLYFATVINDTVNAQICEKMEVTVEALNLEY